MKDIIHLLGLFFLMGLVVGISLLYPAYFMEKHIGIVLSLIILIVAAFIWKALSMKD